MGEPSDILERFLLGLPMRELTARDKVRGRHPWCNYKTHNFTPKEGTARISYEDDVLYSYEHWPIAARVRWGERLVIVTTTDAPPSMFTSKQQWQLRWKIRDLAKGPLQEVSHAQLSFSLLWEAKIEKRELGQIRVVDLGPADTVQIRSRSQWHPSGFKEETFVGDVLFTYRGRFFLSGQDRQDDPSWENYFLARLHVEDTPATCTQAREALRPLEATDATPRQGRWFFLPTSEKPPKDRTFGRDYEKWILRFTQARLQKTEDQLDELDHSLHKGVPLFSCTPAEIERAIEWRLRHTYEKDRHVVSRLGLHNDQVLASGRVLDARHRTVKLGNGRTWHRVVPVRSDGFWYTNEDNLTGMRRER